MIAPFPDFIGGTGQLFIIALRSSRFSTTELDRPAADWKYKP
jgi:hypothetical protein